MEREIYISDGTAVLMKVAAVAVIALCLYVKFVTGGWYTLIPGIGLYPLLSFPHYWFHSRALRPGEKVTPPVFLLAALSHIFFVVGFLLQYDAGDDRDWLTITALVCGPAGTERAQPPSWWPGVELTHEGIGDVLLINLCVFIPTFVTWYLLRKRRRAEAWRLG